MTCVSVKVVRGDKEAFAFRSVSATGVPFAKARLLIVCSKAALTDVDTPEALAAVRAELEKT